MASRKKLKLTDKNSEVDNKRLDIDPLSIIQRFNELPSEILEKIFVHLAPEHLVLIQYSSDSRVAAATVLSKAVFSDSKTTTEEFLGSFFTTIRNSCLREIYLPEMIHIDSQTLFKYISRCKFLTKLSISYRGLSYIRILHIIDKCKTLKELYWYVCANSNKSYETFKLKETNHTLEKIVLNLYGGQDNYDVCRDLLSRCGITKTEVYLNLMNCTITFNLEGKEGDGFIPGSNKIYIYNDILVTWPDDYAIDDSGFLLQQMLWKLLTRNIVYDDFSYSKTDYQGFCISLSKVYPLYKRKTTSNVLPVTPIHTLVLMLRWPVASYNHVPDYDELDDIFYQNLTEEASLKSLKHLSVVKPPFFVFGDFTIRYPIVPVHRSLESLLFIPDIVSKCPFLQEVVLSKIHFEKSCTILFTLKHLKTLKLPPCACLSPSPNPDCSELEPEPHFLENLVESCKHIESFSLHSCALQHCPRDQLTDDDINHIHKWSNLKYLSLLEIRKVRTCSFLKQVAANTKLTSLCLTDVGPEQVCHYGPSLFYAIKLARNLKFLKINQKSFNPSQNLFWMNIAEAETLEGLCILTYLDVRIMTSWILNTIAKLKKLHLFHLSANRAAESLKAKIRKVMTRNNIHNPNVDIRILYNNTHMDFPISKHCGFCHYPFIVPSYHEQLRVN